MLKITEKLHCVRKKSTPFLVKKSDARQKPGITYIIGGDIEIRCRSDHSSGPITDPNRQQYIKYLYLFLIQMIN